MKNKLHYALEARRDLDENWDYIASDLENRTSADHVVNQILDAADQLENFPALGTLLSSIANVDSDYRYLTSGSYLIFYRIQQNDIFIERILYGRRDYLRVLGVDELPPL